MLKLLKLLFYVAVILAVVFVVWFLPKYSFIAKNPGFCTQLTGNLYYCGDGADLKSLFAK